LDPCLYVQFGSDGWPDTGHVFHDFELLRLRDAIQVDGSSSVVFDRTEDFGRHWTTKVLIWPQAKSASLFSFACSSESHCIGLGSAYTASHHGLSRFVTLEWSTVNGGQSWSADVLSEAWNPNLDNPLTTTPSNLTCWSSSDCLSTGALAADIPRATATDPLPVDLLRTTDGGKSWHQMTEPAHARIYSLACFAGGECWGAGTAFRAAHPVQGAVYLSTDGGRSWSQPELLGDTTEATVIDCPTVATCYVAAWRAQTDEGFLFTNRS
jgi:hypothetical protein